MSRIETTKLGSMAVTGVPGAIQVSKVGVFLILQPGDSEEGETGRRMHNFVNVLRKPS